MANFRVRFIPLGGIIDVTKNMYVYELYDGPSLIDILIVDCGVGFPKEKDLGVDFVIPDISYLEDKTDKIRAVLLTHGHEDHISALSFVYNKLGKPPVYSSNLTAVFVESKFREFGLSLQVNRIDYKKEYQFGGFGAKFIHVTHSIPDPTHILIKSPVGSFYHGPDFKFDLTPPFGPPPDFYEIVKAGQEGVLCLLSDCLGSENEGLTLSESIVGKTFEDEIRSTKGKFIMTTFSSNISRIRQCVEAALKFNRKICFLGRSMIENSKRAAEIGYLPIPEKSLIDEKRVSALPPNSVCLIVAGSQGQYDSALSKIASGLRRTIKITKGDKVLFSSDPIPGQEPAVYDVIERLYLSGATVVYSDIANELHASGHGNQEDLKLLMRFTNPKYMIPIGGTVRHQRQYLELAKDLGYRDNQVVLLKEGETFWFEKGRALLGDKIETRNIYVDAYGVGDVGNVILRDRELLAREGIVILNLIIDQSSGLSGVPQFISRGFVFGKNEEAMAEKSRQLIDKILGVQGKTANLDNLKQEIVRATENLFKEETGREPLVVVEIVRI